MKGLLLGLLLLVAIPAFTFEFSPAKEILGVTLIEEAYAASPAELVATAPVEIVAEVSDVEVEPYFDIVKDILGLLNKNFPKVGPIIQASTEIIGGLASFFTLLSVFLLGVLKIPAIVARWKGADEAADKIEKISAKVQYWAQKLSIFNVQKKK